jgi:hypothetical protein
MAKSKKSRKRDRRQKKNASPKRPKLRWRSRPTWLIMPDGGATLYDSRRQAAEAIYKHTGVRVNAETVSARVLSGLVDTSGPLAGIRCVSEFTPTPTSRGVGGGFRSRTMPLRRVPKL